MTVHAVRIKCSKNQESSPDHVPNPAPPELHNVVHDRVKEHIKYNFNPVLEEQDSPLKLREATEASSFNEDHARGFYRFSSDDDRKSLLDSIESKVVADAKWFKIEVHECDHDLPGSERTGCSDWKTERTKGSVPEGV